MRSIRLTFVLAIPLCALVLGLVLLQHNATMTLRADSLDVSFAAVIDGWPPPHQNLSRSAEQDSGSADIDADGGNVVVVWAEGSSAKTLNDGVIMMAWNRVQDPTWRTLVVPEPDGGFVHYQPSVALHGALAHVAWVREDITGTDKGNTQIRYAQCQLALGVCESYDEIAEEEAYALLAPDIVVDPSGVPHAVWVRRQSAFTGTVQYNNRVGGVWSDSPEPVSGGSSACDYTQDNPSVAVDGGHVYVAWDENVQRCPGTGGTAGIYFRVRDDVASPAAGSGTNWKPNGEPWGKQLSEAGAVTFVDPYQLDGYPSIDVGDGWVYVLWERLAYSQTLPIYGTVYSYSLAYRVYTGTAPQQDWWPGGDQVDRWAVLPFTGTSATDTAEYYAGLRPELDMVGKMPHVVWHHWFAPFVSWTEDKLVPLGELPNEHLVDSQHPYKVSYATYDPDADPLNLDQAQASWVSQTMQVFASDHILARPALALASADGGQTYDLHIALHQRQGYVDADGSYAWDVVYTNDVESRAFYFPFVQRQSGVAQSEGGP